MNSRRLDLHDVNGLPARFEIDEHGYLRITAVALEPGGPARSVLFYPVVVPGLAEFLTTVRLEASEDPLDRARQSDSTPPVRRG
jgi:hypothetical protein